MRIERFVEYFEEAVPSTNGWSARCPAHDDHSPSLSIAEGEDGRIVVNCHAGCKPEEVVQALGLEMLDLFPENLPPTTVAELAEVKKLPVAYLQQFGVRDAVKGVGIEIPYFDQKGTEVLVKRRRNLSAKSSRWPSGESVMAYGAWHRERFRNARRLVLVEGESDSWTGWHHGMPVLGFPGAGSVRAALTADLVEGMDSIEVVQEPDSGGEVFVEGARKKLLELGWKGKAVVVKLPDAKDLSDLHIKFGDKFQERYAAAHGAALPLNTAAEVSAEVAPVELNAAKPNLVAVPEDLGDEGWPAPTPLSTPAESGPAFHAADMLPPSIRPWVVDVAERMGAPGPFIGIFAIAGLSTVVGRKVTIRPKEFDSWAVVPNLWALLVARPGKLKTPAMQAGLAHVFALDEAARQEAQAQRAEFELKRTVQRLQRNKVEGDIKKALDKGEDLGPFKKTMESLLEQPLGPRRLLTSDASVESLGELLRSNPNGLLLVRDELSGLFNQFEREGHEADRAFLLEGWSGLSSHTVDRIGRGTVHIPGLRITIAGTIQAEPFRRLVRAAARGGDAGDGLLQRFQLFLSEDDVPGLVAVDRAPDEMAEKAASLVFKHLDKLMAHELGARTDASGLPYLRFSASAQLIFNTWLATLQKELDEHQHPLLVAHFTKYRSLMPSLALLFHLADVAAGKVAMGPVTERAAAMAIRWTEFLGAHARRLLGPIIDAGDAAELIAAKLKSGVLDSPFTERDVYRPKWAGLTQDSVAGGLVRLVEAGWIKKRSVATPGRPRVDYLVNPKVYDLK